MKGHSLQKRLLNIGIVLIIVFFMIYFLKDSLGSIFEELQTTSLTVIGMLLFLGILNQVFEGFVIQELVTVFKKPFPMITGLFASCYSAFFRVVTFGTGTFIAEVNYYHQRGLKASQGVGVALLRFIMLKLGMLTIAIVGLIVEFKFLYQQSPYFVLMIMIGIVVNIILNFLLILLAVSINVQILLVIICNQILKRETLRNVADKLNLQIYSLREAIFTIFQDVPKFIRAYMFSVIKLIVWYLIPYLCLVGDYPELSLSVTFFLVGYATIIAGLLPTPGGMGSFEFLYLLFFKPLVGTVDAVSSLLLYRFATYVLPFLIGLIFEMVEKRKNIRNKLSHK